MSPILFFLVASFLLLFVGHYPGWFDSGELSAANFWLGIGHPPGQPAYTGLGKALALIPIGSIAFRTACLSVLCTALSAVILERFLFHLLAHFGRWLNVPWAHVTSLLVVCLFLFHPSVALQATRTEVYSFLLMISVLAISLIPLAAEGSDARYIWTAAILNGASFSVHPAVSAAISPSWIVPAIFRRRQVIHRTAMGLLWFTIPVGIFLFLPLRALSDSPANWGDPSSLLRAWSVATARDYRLAFLPTETRAPSGWLGQAALAILPISLMALALFGLIDLWRRNVRVAALAIGLLSLLSIIPGFRKDFFLRNPDVHGYMTTSIAVNLSLACAGAVALFARFRVAGWRVSLAAPMLLLLSLWHVPSLGLSGLDARGPSQAEALSRHLDYAPPSSSLHLESDHWLFPVWYRSMVEGRRPDVAVIGTGLLPAPWYRKQLIERYGSAERSLRWYEATNGTRKPLAGFLIGTGCNCDLLQMEFSRECRIIEPSDAFDVNASVCAFVNAKTVSELQAGQNISEAIRLLELQLQLPPAAATCRSQHPVKFPFPLLPKEPQSFLVEPASIIHSLAMMYLGCDEIHAAQKLLEKYPYHVNACLVLSSLYLRANESAKALHVLGSLLPNGSDEVAYLALAQSKIRFVRGEKIKAVQELERAAKILGATHETVAAFSREFID